MTVKEKESIIIEWMKVNVVWVMIIIGWIWYAEKMMYEVCEVGKMKIVRDERYKRVRWSGKWVCGYVVAMGEEYEEMWCLWCCMKIGWIEEYCVFYLVPVFRYNYIIERE